MIPAIGCELCCFYLNQQSILINIDNTSILEIDKQFLKTFYFMHQIGSMNSERATAVFAKLSSSWPVKPSSVELRLALILDNYSQCVCRRVCRLVCRHARKQAHKAQDYSKTF